MGCRIPGSPNFVSRGSRCWRFSNDVNGDVNVHNVLDAKVVGVDNQIVGNVPGYIWSCYLLLSIIPPKQGCP